MAEEDSLSVPPLPIQKVELSLNEDLGVTFDGNNRPFIVKAVEPGGQGARAMVEVGSKLLRIDGQEVMFMSSTLKRLQFLKKDAVEFEFEREDKESKRRAEEQAHKDKQLFEAAKDGDVNGDILPLLLAGAKPDGHRATGGHGSTALLEASGANRVEAVRRCSRTAPTWTFGTALARAASSWPAAAASAAWWPRCSGGTRGWSSGTRAAARPSSTPAVVATTPSRRPS